MVGVASGSEAEDKVRSEVVQWCLGRGVELVPWETNTPATQAEDSEEGGDYITSLVCIYTVALVTFPTQRMISPSQWGLPGYLKPCRLTCGL